MTKQTLCDVCEEPIEAGLTDYYARLKRGWWYRLFRRDWYDDTPLVFDVCGECHDALVKRVQQRRPIPHCEKCGEHIADEPGCMVSSMPGPRHYHQDCCPNCNPEQVHTNP